MIKFILMGHVDYGKSTYAGRLLYELGYFTQHQLDQVNKESQKNRMEKWNWAYLLDQNQEERQKGKTHEFTSYKFEYENKKYKLIDTPGHEIFVRETIDGLLRNNLDEDLIGVLLVSADSKEFDSGFSNGMIKRHLILMRCTGIKQIIIMYNKMDLIKYNKSDPSFVKRRQQLQKFIKNLNFEQEPQEMYISAYNDDPTKLKQIFEKLNVTQEVNKNIQPKIYEQSTKFIAKIQILPTIEDKQILITKGYQGMIHFTNYETQEQKQQRLKKIDQEILTNQDQYEDEIQSQEQQITIINLRNDKYIDQKKDGQILNTRNQLYLTQKTYGQILIQFLTEQTIYKNQKFILRNANDTIGYGYFIRAKN